ncbi:hypothetical protein SCHPADRAFT_910292 [Schizopora paradoxa]|uniref:BTB domain-containing protein n=1 Tax=Schizopora paradoxa TaxID=27342 RepID=A0A0H2R3Y6_9AGAM|nr:hypothetical protein SCHPADRAFT_910292 [Schizopora paradoxa]
MAAVGGEFHPDFSSDGDIVLQSKEGTKFRLESVILKASSSAFRNMLRIPRDSNETSDTPILLTEDARVLAFLFNCINPAPSTMDLRDYDEIWRVVEAADKFDMPCVLKILRFVVLTEAKFYNNPLDLYALASSCNWKDVLRCSSKSSLKQNILLSKNMKILERAKHGDLIALLKLHTKRKEILEEAVRRGENYYFEKFDEDTSYHMCTKCYSPFIGDSGEVSESEKVVEVFRSRVRDCINRCPLGLDLAERDFWEDSVGEVAILKCQKCGSEVFDIRSTTQRIKLLLSQGNDILPSEVGDVDDN